MVGSFHTPACPEENDRGQHLHEGSFSKEMKIQKANHMRISWGIRFRTIVVIKRYVGLHRQLIRIFILNLIVRKELLAAKPLLRYCSYPEEPVI